VNFSIIQIACIKIKKKIDEPEKTIWVGNPSHLYYLFIYIIGGLSILLHVLGIFIIFYAIIDRNCKVFTITNKRIKSKSGILDISAHEIFAKDIRSVNLQPDILERLLGIGTINIGSAGTGGIEVSFTGITQAEEIQEEIQKLRGKY
jgi:uncharacterized membrane protein YdbT with pleckstrin-like domain